MRERERGRGRIEERREKEKERETRSLLGELFYIHAINVSAQTHTLEHGEHLLPLSSETRQTVQKRQRAAGEERNVSHFHRMVREKASPFFLFCYFVILFFICGYTSGVSDRRRMFLPLSLSLSLCKCIQLVVYVAHCPSDTIGQ